MPIVVDPVVSVNVLPVTIDPTSEDTGAELVVNDGAPGGSGFVVGASPDLTPPTPNPIWIDSYDTEGSIPADDETKYSNRTIGLTIRVYGTSAGDLETNLGALYEKVGKLNRHGGTLLFTTPADTEIIFDLLPEAQGGVSFDEKYLRNNRCDVELKLTAKPLWRAAVEIDAGTFTETSLAALVFSFTGPGNGVPALGRLVVTDLSGNDQWQVDVGLQVQHYDASAPAALQYQAEDFTPTGTSTKTAGAAGASGSGSNVVRNTDLVPTWQAVLRSEIDATNAALTHKGSFRVKVRIYRPTSNSGVVGVRLEYGMGDYRTPDRSNSPVYYAADEREGAFTWADLGVVSISPDSDRWEFRVLANSTVAGDEIDVDVVELFPTTERCIELAAGYNFETPSAFAARSEFDTESGAIAGDSLAIGGPWAGSGPSDFSAGSGIATRTATSDVNANTGGRFATVDVNHTHTAVQVDVMTSALGSPRMGVVARYVDANNWLQAHLLMFTAADLTLQVNKRVGGTVTPLSVIDINDVFGIAPAVNTAFPIRLVADAAGRWMVWVLRPGSIVPTLAARGYDPVLASGGALASGDIGIYDSQISVTATTRTYDNFFGFIPTPDAAIFANQSLELRHDGVSREDGAGNFRAPMSNRGRGRFLRIPAGDTGRMIVKGYRNDPVTMTDPAADDIQAQLFITERGLLVPA